MTFAMLTLQPWLTRIEPAFQASLLRRPMGRISCRLAHKEGH